MDHNEFYPLTIRGEGWSLRFRSSPTPGVIVEGRAPSRDELAHILAIGNAGAFVLAECLLVAAQCAEVLPLPTTTKETL